MKRSFRYLDDGTLKKTERTLGRSLCLPMHAGLSDEDAEAVASATAAEIRVQLR